MNAAIIPLHRARPIKAQDPGLLAGLKAMHDVAQKLERNGFTVIAGFHDVRPELQVLRNRLIDQLLEANEAGYFYQSPTERRGEFFGEGNDGTKVRVVWIERMAS